MTQSAAPAHDLESTAADRQASRARPSPQASRSAPARQTPRRRRPAGKTQAGRGNLDATEGDHDGTDPALGDYGLFGPGSATWHLMGEPILWVAGIRALYLQALDPRTMLGTWQNSALVHRHEAWARFLRTTEFVRTRTYGSTPDAERAGRRIRKIHASLTGTDANGTVFRLDEPEQLLWVHCAEVDSYVAICRRCGMGATPGQLDAFVDEQRRSATLVGLDPAKVPASVAELDAYYAEARRRAWASGEAKKSLLMSFNPPVPPALFPLKLVAPAVNALAFAALPRWARKLYGAPGSPVTDILTTAALEGLYHATRAAPARLRYTPTVRHARQIIREYERYQDAAP
jgi:uncharacterized protein (DUF2236 family)